MKAIIIVLMVTLFAALSLAMWQHSHVYVVDHRGEQIVTNHNGAISYALVYGSPSTRVRRNTLNK